MHVSSPCTGKFDVNLEKPWDQGDSCFVVKKFRGYCYHGSDYDGVQIQVHGDSRDINNDCFKLEAMAAKPTNKFKLTVPLLASSFWRDQKRLKEQLEPQCIYDGNMATNTKFKKIIVGQRVKTMVLVFPEDMMLTDKCFTEEKEKPNDELEIKEFHTACFAKTGQSEVDDNGVARTDEGGDTVPIINMVNTICWRLINTASIDEIEGSTKAKKGAAGIAAALAKGKTQMLDDSDED